MESDRVRKNLPGRSAQATTNLFHRALKYESVVEHDVVSIEGAYNALQKWAETPIAFDRDGASKTLNSSTLISKKMTQSPTLKRLVEALASDEPALQNCLTQNTLELVEFRTGSVDADQCGFCIGADFIPVKIPTLLHDAFQTRKFDILKLFVPTKSVKRKFAETRAQKIRDIYIYIYIYIYMSSAQKGTCRNRMCELGVYIYMCIYKLHDSKQTKFPMSITRQHIHCLRLQQKRVRRAQLERGVETFN